MLKYESHKLKKGVKKLKFIKIFIKLKFKEKKT